jgi:PPP family 3-phenylpropionic acid transporter
MTRSQFAVTRYYFTVFLMPGVIVTYLPIWLDSRGISESQIGIINTLPMLLVMLLSVHVGRFADRARDWKQTIVVGNGLAAAFCLLVDFGNNFWVILLLWTLTILPSTIVGPIADAATLRLSVRQGFSFGVVRAWGTVGFLLVTAVSGVLLGWLGPDAFVWMLAAAAITRAICAVFLPKMRGDESYRPAISGKFLSRELMAEMQPWVLLPLVGGALLFSTHLVMNGFSALVWKQQGLSEGTIGALVATGALAEAITMFSWQWFRVRFSARHLILAATVAGIFRWTAMAFSPPLWMLFGLQSLQSISFTFGFLGCLYFLADRTSEHIAAEAQSLFAVMQQISAIIVVLSFGVIFGFFGPPAFLFIAAITVAVAAMLVFSLSRHGAKKEG